MTMITMRPAPAVHDDAACPGCDECEAVCSACYYCEGTTRAAYERGEFDPGMCECRPADCGGAPYDSFADL